MSFTFYNLHIVLLKIVYWIYYKYLYWININIYSLINQVYWILWLKKLFKFIIPSFFNKVFSFLFQVSFSYWLWNISIFLVRNFNNLKIELISKLQFWFGKGNFLKRLYVILNFIRAFKKILSFRPGTRNFSKQL